MILSLFNAGVRGVFLPSSHFQIELAHWPDPEGQLSSNSQRFCVWDDQIQSLKKRCNAFIPDFFGVHDMYLLVIGSYDHSR